jgi:hypothetical protein
MWTSLWRAHVAYHELGVKELESSVTLTKTLRNCIVAWHGWVRSCAMRVEDFVGLRVTIHRG